VAGDAFVNAGALCGLPDGALQAAFVQVVAADLTPGPSPRGRGGRAGINGEAVGGEDVLPEPFVAGVGEFSLQRIGKVNGAVAFGQVFFVQALDALQVLLERFDEAVG
jgi:hypothetical protein